jgi:methyl-accepting chemotaxis protein
MKAGVGVKVSGGFGLLLLIAVALGVLAIFNMLKIGKEATALAEEHLKRAQVAAKVENATQECMLNMRSFGLAEQNAYYEKALKDIENIDAALKNSMELAKTAKNLKGFKEQNEIASALKTEYVEAAKKTYEIVSAKLALQKILDENYGVFLKNCVDYKEVQKEQLLDEIKKAVPFEKISERLSKIDSCDKLSDLAGSVNLLTSKAIASRSSGYIDEANKIFLEMEAEIAKLAPLTKLQINKDQLKKCKESSDIYKKAMLDYKKLNIDLEEIGKARSIVAGKFTGICSQAANEGLASADKIAEEAANNLSQASRIMIIGLVIAIILGVLAAWAITVGILRPINKAAEIANGLASQSEELSAVSSSLLSASEEMSAQSNNVAAATEEMSANINAMASAGEEMNVNAQSVASASEQMSRNVANVAGAIEELSASMKAVGERSTGGAKIAAEAMGSSRTASETMSQLGKAAQEIGK